MVFTAGFVLGSVRVPFLVPRFGERLAELAEMPLMLLAMFVAAGYVVGRRQFTMPERRWLLVGLLALLFLVAAEFLMASLLAGRGVVEYVADRDPVSGSVYLAMLLVFAVMPWLRRRLGGLDTADPEQGP
ncbi:MAG: hypothetical protein JSS46_12415 [Proteobacteria bacterium]|nr:hypothetical protein [Pseudomonadota bacterium]